MEGYNGYMEEENIEVHWFHRGRACDNEHVQNDNSVIVKFSF